MTLSSFFLRMTKPSMTGESGMYSSVASSARSPNDSSTGVVCVCDPAIVFGVPALPITSTAWGKLEIVINLCSVLFKDLGEKYNTDKKKIHDMAPRAFKKFWPEIALSNLQGRLFRLETALSGRARLDRKVGRAVPVTEHFCMELRLTSLRLPQFSSKEYLMKD